MFRLALKSVWARKVKLGLLVGIIMASVGFIVGTFTFTNTINKGFDNLFATVYKDTAVVVRGQKLSNDPDDSNFGARNMVTKDAVEKARAVPGVVSADGVIEVPLTVLDKQNKAIPNSSGAYARKWFESPANANKLVEGVKPTKDGEAVINRHLAQKVNLKIGDSVKIALGDQPESLKVVGIATFGTTNGTDLDVSSTRRPPFVSPNDPTDTTRFGSQASPVHPKIKCAMQSSRPSATRPRTTSSPAPKSQQKSRRKSAPSSRASRSSCSGSD